MPNELVASYFEALGKECSALWRASGQTEMGLVDAAERAMRSVEIPSGVDASSILEHVVRTPDLPPQGNADRFGQPPVVMYRDDELFIQVLFWLEGTTAIHDHGFDGAFGVLQGSSLHVTYDFDTQEQIDKDRLALGELRPLDAEVLQPGAARRIESGPGFIHALFHLEMPTVSIVIRNRKSRSAQFGYRFPGLAYDTWWSDPTYTKRLQSLSALDRIDQRRAVALATEMITELPVSQAWLLLDSWMRTHARDSSLELVGGLARRVPSLGPTLEQVVEHELAQQNILRRRALLREFHQRAFLALMANLTTTDFTLDLIGHLAPGRPARETLFDWAEELSGPSLRSVTGLSLDAAQLVQLRALPAEEGASGLLEAVRSQWQDPMRRVREVLAPL